MQESIYNTCLQILQRELIPAFGCTEPIAIAYASAVARKNLGMLPETMTVSCSGNIVKNVKGVVVPATDGMRGIEAAAVIGAVGGDPDSGLEVLHAVTDDHRRIAKELLSKDCCHAKLLDSSEKLHILVEMSAGEHSALVELCRTHDGIVRIEKDGSLLLHREVDFQQEESEEESILNFETIYEFAQSVRIEDVKALLDRQIEYNTSIAEHGLEHPYGAGIGATLVAIYGRDIKTLARALPAAGSDARMGGCEMPVVVNSGSGNQGMTVSLPVIAYAKDMKVGSEKLYRALCVSNLCAIYQKEQIGRLSAYCGAVSAGAGAGAGIAYLLGGGVKEVASVVSNTLANVAGIICDGAKASCAAKIASSVEAALLAIDLTFRGHSFQAGEGVVQQNPDTTVQKVAAIAREGMRTTDEVILQVMVNG